MTLKEMIKWYLDNYRDKFLSKRKLRPGIPIGLADKAKKFVVKGRSLVVLEEDRKSKTSTQ